GVVGRADRFVQTAAELAPLIRRLLGHTWVVENLSHAVALSETSGRGLNFITLSGEFLSADGVLVAGQRSTAAGLISRRSQLRSLRAEIAQWQEKINDLTQLVVALEEQVGRQDEVVAKAVATHQAANEALAEQKLRINSANQRNDQLTEQHKSLETEF